MRKRDDFEDDGRTIADMSGIGPAPTLRPHRRKADAPPPEPASDRPWDCLLYTSPSPRDS